MPRLMIDLKPQIKTRQTKKQRLPGISYSNCSEPKTKRKSFKKLEEKTPYLYFLGLLNHCRW